MTLFHSYKGDPSKSCAAFYMRNDNCLSPDFTFISPHNKFIIRCDVARQSCFHCLYIQDPT